MACLQIYRELFSLATFLQLHSKSEEVSYFPRQNTYPSLKNTCHIKLKLFLLAKLLKNLLLENGAYLKVRFISLFKKVIAKPLNKKKEPSE